MCNLLQNNGDGTVTDLCTNLMWTESILSGIGYQDPVWPGECGVIWEKAIKIAESSNCAGYSDWRLPNIRELVSTGISLGTKSQWSSTRDSSNSNNYWYVNFYYWPYIGTASKTSEYYVRLIRNIEHTTLDIKPDIQLSATSYNFGEVGVGNSLECNLVISNMGDAPLTVYRITSDNPAFTTVSLLFPKDITPGNNLEVTVRFSPDEGKPYSGSLRIESNDPDEPEVLISLIGTGISNIGCAIIAVGTGDRLNIMDNKANTAYKTLTNLGFDDEFIYYLNNRPQEAEIEVDGNISSSNLKKVITEWASERINPSSPLILYLISHGDKEAKGVLDFTKNDVVSGDDLDQWLETFSTKIKQKYSKEPQVLIVIDACYSGSFITDYLMSISSPNRVILTSTTDTSLTWWPNRFSLEFFQALQKEENVRQAFISASENYILGLASLKIPWLLDEPWLNDTGTQEGYNGKFIEQNPPISKGDPGFLAAKMKIGKPSVQPPESLPYIYAALCSPGDLQVHDSEGRVTGLVNGNIKEEIPYSIYIENKEKIVLIFSSLDTYRYKVIGTGTGTYGLVITSVEDRETNTFTATDIPIAFEEVHQYSIDWTDFSQGEENITLQIDFDGDGKFEKAITEDSKLTRDEFILQTKTIVHIDPNTLNLKSKEKWITAYIELPEGYVVEKIVEDDDEEENNVDWDNYRSLIDISTIKLNGQVSAVSDSKYGFVKDQELEDRDENGLPELMVKFNKAELMGILETGDAVPLSVTGKVSYNNELIDFEGTDTVRVIGKGVAKSVYEESTEETSLFPERIILFQNSPNPFNSYTKISYGLPERSYVRLIIYNLLGQEVIKLVDGEQSAGYHNIMWDASEISGGIYLYRLETKTYTETRKMLFLK
jgi:hypothetical protein